MQQRAVPEPGGVLARRHSNLYDPRRCVHAALPILRDCLGCAVAAER